MRWLAGLAYSLDNSLWFRKQYTVSHLTCLCSANYARRSDNLRQYAERMLACSVLVVVSSWMVVFHLPKGLACELPFFHDSRVLTCDTPFRNTCILHRAVYLSQDVYFNIDFHYCIVNVGDTVNTIAVVAEYLGHQLFKQFTSYLSLSLWRITTSEYL